MKVIDKRVKKAIESVKPKPHTKSSVSDFETYVKMIEKKAYELYEKRRRQHGHDQEDWQQAKKLVEDELCKGNEVFEI